MNPVGSRSDPYRKFNFRVEIEDIPSADFLSVEGIEALTDVIHYREGGENPQPRKLPGLHKYSNITLKRGVTANRDLWDWRKTVLDGRTERRNGSIIILDEDREEVFRINFFNAWPCGWKVGSLDALESEVLIEELELTVESFSLD